MGDYKKCKMTRHLQIQTDDMDSFMTSILGLLVNIKLTYICQLR